LNPNQYGFRKNHSTDLALVQIYDKITNAMANKEHVIGLFLDLSKAFDTLNHEYCLINLTHMEYEGKRYLGLEIIYLIENNMLHLMVLTQVDYQLNAESPKAPSWDHSSFFYM